MIIFVFILEQLAQDSDFTTVWSVCLCLSPDLSSSDLDKFDLELI